jgi:hypothetical protein
MDAITTTPATVSQISYITDLVAKRIINAEHTSRLLATIDRGGLDKRVASDTIDWLKRQPVRPAEVIIPSVDETLANMAAQLEVNVPSDDETISTAGPNNTSVASFVPAGRYALVQDGEVRFYKVDRPTEGRWAGSVFVKRQAGDDLFPVRNRAERISILAAIGIDPQAAMLRYGVELGHCGHCGRTLTNESSRARGIGPICAQKMDW